MSNFNFDFHHVIFHYFALLVNRLSVYPCRALFVKHLISGRCLRATAESADRKKANKNIFVDPRILFLPLRCDFLYYNILEYISVKLLRSRITAHSDALKVFSFKMNMESWPQDVQFIYSAVPHSSLSESDKDELETYLVGCTCQSLSSPNPECCLDTCECLARTPSSYDHDGLLKSEYLSGKGSLIIECGGLCGCAVQASSCIQELVNDPHNVDRNVVKKPRRATSFPCGNRTVGYARYLYALLSSDPSVIPFSNEQMYCTWKFLEIFRSFDKGFAVRCSIDLPPGRFICEYAGELISTEEAHKRMQQFPDDTYVFALRESSSQAVVTTCIDAREEGNWGRMINHSCDPNLVMLPVRIDTIIPVLCFFTKRAVPAGEELTVDYDQGNFFSAVSGVTADRKNLCDIVLSKKKCLCSAPCCRGFLPFNKDLFT
ncbi:probable histone-lysine N-methyltransferase set-23 isoform X2 [Paramacrobiotus metropolitanus]|uniref:probable histone-lysine N-methyltransferase set-23 isoform X2 n=1 Tax=Paramacrobiotus metropolitanus TaxID=2943436 RepID=UPI0024464CCB|nr:probable histone-lysine N-methyltransferase set-23 isoform X2 [Paramacrobiotus metropolitanus]